MIKSNFSLVAYIHGVISKKPLPNLNSRFIYVFYKKFYFFTLIFRPLIHFGEFFVYGIRWGLTFYMFMFCMDAYPSSSPSIICWKEYSFLTELSWCSF